METSITYKDVAEHLINTFMSVEDAIEDLGGDLSLSEDTEFMCGVDDYALRCSVCDWWYEPCYIHDHPITGDFVCDDCLEEIER